MPLAIADLTDVPCEWLLQTARIDLRTGSLSVTAAQEYCHRDTVINRLDSFANLTGIDARQPSGAAVGLLTLNDQ